MRIRPSRPIRRQELLAVHRSRYLALLRRPKYVAKALQFPLLKYFPGWLLDWTVLRPMRWATMGTVIGAREAIHHGYVVNLGGGFHHARPDGGEGFCIYSDIALAVDILRRDGFLSEDQKVVYIDLDAHQGNGVCHAWMNDRRAHIFDLYNGTVYPAYDIKARERIDCNLRITGRVLEEEYLQLLTSHLPDFIHSIEKQNSIGLAIYNAGSDVFVDDPLGDLNLSPSAILKRDMFVVSELRKRGIPTLMLPSGGYTPNSYKLFADSVIQILETELSGGFKNLRLDR